MERDPGAGEEVLGSDRLWGHLGVRPSAWRKGRPFRDGESGRKSMLAMGVGDENDF